MQSQKQPADPLKVAETLVGRLAEAGIRYGVYKNISSITDGLAGITDLDLLVAADDAQRFREVITALNGISGVPCRFYDNAVAGREDWFVPDSSGGYLHLDTSFGLRIGPKFWKRYGALDYESVRDWQPGDLFGPALARVAPYEEARIAVLRSIFKLTLWPGRSWVRADHGSTVLLSAALPAGESSCILKYQFGPHEMTCRVRQRGGLVELESSAVRGLRSAVRAHCGSSSLAAPLDYLVHLARRTIYFVAARLTQASPGKTVAKRTIRPTGIIIALIGPDGVGKSTQTGRLVSSFQKKFRCTSVYLGSNDGSWMKIRGKLRAFFRRGRSPAAGAPSADKSPRQRKERGKYHLLGSALWRLVIAVQRYAAIRKAVRLAGSGAIVITDRWPQNLEFGMLDGPSVPPPQAMRLAFLVSRIERSLYRRMEQFKPNLTIHLDADFATSYARKPGDIEEADFELRLALMKEMRGRDPAIVIVDSRQAMQQVTRDMSQRVWSALSVHSTFRNR